MTKIINDFSDSHYSLNLCLLVNLQQLEWPEHCLQIQYLSDITEDPAQQ